MVNINNLSLITVLWPQGLRVMAPGSARQLILGTLSELGTASLMTFVVGVTSCLVLILLAYKMAQLLKKFEVARNADDKISKLGPLVDSIVQRPSSSITRQSL